MYNKSMVSQDKKEYVRGYEVNGVSPLPHYFEEVYGHIIGIPKIGIRGDDHYFWYSKNGSGAAYYEVGEQKKSADATLIFFNSIQNRKKYFREVAEIVDEVKSWIAKVDEEDIEKIPLKKLSKLFKKTMLLDAKVFSYYIVSQPYRLQSLENSVRYELKKRVAAARIDYYLAKLIAYPELTKTAQEELDRSNLILSAKQKLKTRKGVNQELKELILGHYDKYKLLSLGDGQWEFDSEKYIEQFIKDFDKPYSYYKARVREIETQPRLLRQEKEKLTDELYIDGATQELVDFLSEMGHVRFSLRIEGFIPLIYASNIIATELAGRIGYTEEGDIAWQTHDEMNAMVASQKLAVSAEEIHRRRGKSDTYMVKLDKGEATYLYGADAEKMFSKLVPEIDHKKTDEIRGVTAEPGQVKARATVYHWGDDMGRAMKDIKNNPILVAGQTRPAMMPIIREAQGIVTDEGGVTSHAAIIARELGIPTIINTHVGTKVFKTGDKIHLNADEGVARKI